MPERKEYLEKFRYLQSTYLGPANPRSSVDQSEANCMEFASANLRHLLPEIPVDEHVRIINDILFNQARADLDENSFFLLERLDIRDSRSILKMAKERPVIFSTFHFGSYRLINALLISKGISYILPVNSEIFASQTARYLKNSDAAKIYSKSSANMTVIDAELPTAALTMARKTRGGCSLLAYIDGNTGVQGAVRRDEKLLRISLLGRTIYARKGIAFLSHFLKLPIVPVVCEITGDMQYTMTFHEKIQPDGTVEEREVYCRMATERIYAVLGDYLKKSPGQWEGWLDMQKYLDMDGIADSEGTDEDSVETASPTEDIADSKLVFNRERFGFIIQEDGRALLDKDSYKLLSLPQNITDILEAYREPAAAPSADAAQEQHDIVTQLVSMGMLSVVSQ